MCVKDLDSGNDADDDQCKRHGCSPFATCNIITPKGVTCTCKFGYTGDGRQCTGIHSLCYYH